MFFRLVTTDSSGWQFTSASRLRSALVDLVLRASVRLARSRRLQRIARWPRAGLHAERQRPGAATNSQAPVMSRRSAVDCQSLLQTSCCQSTSGRRMTPVGKGGHGRLSWRTAGLLRNLTSPTSSRSLTTAIVRGGNRGNWDERRHRTRRIGSPYAVVRVA
jgi:hypothetical protein